MGCKKSKKTKTHWDVYQERFMTDSDYNLLQEDYVVDCNLITESNKRPKMIK